MKEKPIIFSTPMVKAILEGRKTQTRRVIDKDISNQFDIETDGTVYAYINRDTGDSFKPVEVAPYHAGDILWVRETFQMYPASVILNSKVGNCPYKKIPKEKPDSYYIEYRATSDKAFCGKWRSSLFMPKYAARLFLKVTSVRVERLRDITDADAIAEGIYEVRHNGWFYCDPATTKYPNRSLAVKPKQAYMWLWDQINDKRGYAWISNPWVWVYEFMRVKK